LKQFTDSAGTTSLDRKFYIFVTLLVSDVNKATSHKVKAKAKASPLQGQAKAKASPMQGQAKAKARPL